MKRTLSVLIAMLLILCATVPAFAAVSPTGAKDITVTVVPTEGGGGSYDAITKYDPVNGATIQFVPKPNDGYTFDHWVIEGDYEIISGSLETGDLVIKAYSDIIATPYYVKSGPTTASEATMVTGATIQQNTEKTSPKTGSNDMTGVVGVTVGVSLLFAGIIVCTLLKKRKTDK